MEAPEGRPATLEKCCSSLEVVRGVPSILVLTCSTVCDCRRECPSMQGYKLLHVFVFVIVYHSVGELEVMGCLIDDDA